jgi:hypothetical protein
VTNRTPIDHPIGAIALLEEPNRQRLHELAAASREPVGRDDRSRWLGSAESLPPSTSIHSSRAACSKPSTGVAVAAAGQALVALPGSIGERVLTAAPSI